MNIKQLIDYVSNHLVKQGAKSVLENHEDVDYEGNWCAYRGSNGRMCAVGVLIPDEMYSPQLEDKTVSKLLNDEAFYDAFVEHLESTFPSSDKTSFYELNKVLSGLQDIHDNSDPKSWKNAFEKFKNSMTHKLRQKEMV